MSPACHRGAATARRGRLRRRSGKTRFAAAIAAHVAATAPTKRLLAAGEVGTVLICAVDRVQARVALDAIKSLFLEVPVLRPLVLREQAEGLELRHRVKIEVRASNFRSVRGVTLLAAIIDEIAFLRDETSAVPDVELLRALKPALLTTGGVVIGISSPWRKAGVLWAKYRAGALPCWPRRGESPHVAVARMTCPEAAAGLYGALGASDSELATAGASFVRSGIVRSQLRKPTRGSRYTRAMDDDTMALLLLAILRDGKPRTAEGIAAAVARMIRALREDDARPHRDHLCGAGGTDPGREPRMLQTARWRLRAVAELA